MKAHFLTSVGFILLNMTMSVLSAQEVAGNSFYTVNGVVKDQSTKKKLDQVTVSVPGWHTGVVSNEDGFFSLKINDTIRVTSIELSHLGYFNLRIPVDGRDRLNETYYLIPNPLYLNEVVVLSWSTPEALIRAALEKIETNYSTIPALLTGFYRETAQKKRDYISISEAVIQIYKSPYTKGIYDDRVQIHKGRKLLSEKPSDTLAVKLLGGPNLSVNMDIVKNPEALFDEETMSFYQFEMRWPTVLNDRPQFVIAFTPKISLLYPLSKGIIYIDQQSLAFTRAEYALDMSDRDKVTDFILMKKPPGLRFKPEEVSFLVTYRQQEGKTYLNYVRNDIRFKCDWKRRLFATGYAVVCEMVVTDSQSHDIENIPRKAAFREKDSLGDKVMGFYDENFWGAYNIIEPSESLESAVNKLKKKR